MTPMVFISFVTIGILLRKARTALFRKNFYIIGVLKTNRIIYHVGFIKSQ